MPTILATYYAKIQDMPEKEYKVEILEDGPIKRLSIDGTIYEVDYNVGGDSINSFIIGNRSYGIQISSTSSSEYEVQHRGESYQIELKGELDHIHNTKKAALGGRQVITAPMPGVILKSYVKVGDKIHKGDPLCVLVAMKMENEIRATMDGIVKDIFVTENMKVGLNDRIIIIE